MEGESPHLQVSPKSVTRGPVCCHGTQGFDRSTTRTASWFMTRT